MTEITEIERFEKGKKASFYGILVNLLLFIIKIIIGISSKSVAIAADAVNNLTDAASSGVSLAGFNISARPADDEHPFGHGRMEDISALIVAVIVTALALDLGKSSIEKIISPSSVTINRLQCGFLLFTIFMKFILFVYFRHVGKKIDSLSLQGAAFDSLSDILGTTVVLLSIGAGYLWDVKLDGYAGLLVAAIIFKGGISLIKETVEPLMGGCPDRELVEKMKTTLMQNKEIHGIHDIILHSYGHNRYFATAHAELSENLSSTEAHDILEQAEINLSQQLPITLVLHCDPFNTDNPASKQWRVRLENSLLAVDDSFKLYDFRMEQQTVNGKAELYFYFHLLTPRKYINRESDIQKHLEQSLAACNVSCKLHITYVNSFI